MWVSWYEEKNRTHKEEECESIDRDYLKVKISLEFTAALAMKQRTDGIEHALKCESPGKPLK